MRLTRVALGTVALGLLAAVASPQDREQGRAAADPNQKKAEATAKAGDTARAAQPAAKAAQPTDRAAQPAAKPAEPAAKGESAARAGTSRKGQSAPILVPALVFDTVAINDASGNGNGKIDPNECFTLNVTLRNTGPDPATGVSAVLTSSTTGVTITTGNSTYPNIPGSNGTGTNNTPFRVSTSAAFTQGTLINFSLAVTTNEGPFTIPFTIQTGYIFVNNTPVPIPDLSTVNMLVSVSGVTGAITKVTFTMFITHTFDADLDINLFAANNTTNIDLTSDNGGGGDNFGTDCPADANDTTFDDAAATSITVGVAPFVGSFRPEQPLTTFNGLTGAAVNGNWRMQVTDDAGADIGSINCVKLQIFTGEVGPGQCRALSVGDVSTTEGNTGTTNAIHPVTLDATSTSQVTVGFATADGTATAGADYTSTSGTLTFAPGVLTQNVTVSIIGETVVEPDETYFVNLSVPTGGGYFGDNQGIGTIVNDDAAAGLDNTGELVNGFKVTGDLASAGGVPDTDIYRISQKPFSSYEVVVDATSGDITPVALERLNSGGTVVQASVPIGTGQSRSLRWINSTTNTVEDETVRVASGGCTTNCGADDIYRLRAYETTFSVPRFNNAGTQVTVLLLQNPTDYTINTNVHFWSATGTLLATQSQAIPAKNVLVLNTSSIPALVGQGGSVSVTHDGRYGDLAGKTVALEPATGFSFDSPMAERAR